MSPRKKVNHPFLITYSYKKNSCIGGRKTEVKKVVGPTEIRESAIVRKTGRHVLQNKGKTTSEKRPSVRPSGMYHREGHFD